MNANERKESLTLEILQTIEQQNDVTQRHLANQLGVALGLANSYLKRCVRKGLVKIHQAPANRYLYYLTPKGFAEKSRLTAMYLSSSFDFYRRAGNSLVSIYTECEQHGWNRLIFCGVSELAEIASIRAFEHQMSITGIWDINTREERFLHLPVLKNLPEPDQYDACLITSLAEAHIYLQLLEEQVEYERVLIPSILGLNIEAVKKQVATG